MTKVRALAHNVLGLQDDAHESTMRRLGIAQGDGASERVVGDISKTSVDPKPVGLLSHK